MAEGWIKLHRSIQEHWLWKDDAFDKRSAWIDLLLMANHEEQKRYYNGRLVTYQRGQIFRSTYSLANRWKWSRKKVSHFLKILEFDKMVTTKVTTEGTTITIVNYDKYQIQGTTKGTTTVASEELPKHTNKNDKNDKKIIYKPTFGTFEKQNYNFAEIEEGLGIK